MADDVPQIEDWRGVVGSRVDPPHALGLEGPMEQGKVGGSGTFRGRCSDDAWWWIKPLNNRQGPTVVVTEFLVGQFGRLIGAPVCSVDVIRIPEELAGWEYRNGLTLEVGLAHGSRAISDALEVDQASSSEHRQRDDNARRHAGVFALYDWCWGGDVQWLHCESDDRALHSHDHGWYFPDTGPDWNTAAMLADVDEAHPLGWPTQELDKDELLRLADTLESLEREELVAIVSSVPASWPATDSELEVLGFYVDRRRRGAAARLRGMTGGAA